ncbi:MAG: hypothetical protein ACI84O_000245 [Myxococcota bacterium]|jgi:uncharacterized protein YbaP (TraB family)
MNKLFKSCSIILPLAFGLFSACSPAAIGLDIKSSSPTVAPPVLWKVSSSENTSYLFGTMHVSDPRVTTLHPTVAAAFTESDAVFTELKESALELGVKVAQLGMLPAGSKLYDVIPPEMYAKIRGYVTSKSMTMTMLDGLRPWMVGMQLQLLDAMQYMQGTALDLQLTIRAREEDKEVGGIETIEEQIAALAFGNEEQQIELLGLAIDKTISKASNEKSDIEIMLEHYINGDIDALWAFAEKELDGASALEIAAFDALLIQRNFNMAERIAARMKAHPQSMTFYAFGALHFAGPQGVDELLKEMGYTVERVK